MCHLHNERGESVPDIESMKQLAILLGFSIDKALDIEDIEDDEKGEWLIISGFIIGNALGYIFKNFMFGYIFAMIGLGIAIIIQVLKKRK